MNKCMVFASMYLFASVDSHFQLVEGLDVGGGGSGVHYSLKN